jgi:hypothetical protein
MNISRISAVIKVLYSFRNIGDKLITTKNTKKKKKDKDEFTKLLKSKMKSDT